MNFSCLYLHRKKKYVLSVSEKHNTLSDGWTDQGHGPDTALVLHYLSSRDAVVLENFNTSLSFHRAIHLVTYM